jgi:hypothetical protein
MEQIYEDYMGQADEGQSIFESFYQLELIDPRSCGDDQAPGIHFWPKKLSACVMLITPDLAMSWLERNKKNRNLKNRKVLELVSTIEDDHWRLNGESICFSYDGLLLDGQHRLHAIVKSDIPAAAVTVFGVNDEVMRTYDQGVKRTNADHYNIQGEKNYTKLGATLQLLYMWKTRQFHRPGPQFNPDQGTLDKLLDQYPEIRNSVQKTSRTRRFMSTANAAVLHHLFSQTKITMVSTEQLAADFFFERLVSGENLTRQDAIYRLREALIENRTNKKLSTVQIRAMTIKTWNVFSRCQKRGRIQWDSSEQLFPEIFGLEN